jgi:hypothetical protein
LIAAQPEDEPEASDSLMPIIHPDRFKKKACRIMTDVVTLPTKGSIESLLG